MCGFRANFIANVSQKRNLCGALSACQRAITLKSRTFDAGWSTTLRPKLGTAEHLNRDSFSIAQEGGDHARIAATVKYGKDKEWFFIRRVHDQKIP